MWTPKGDTTLDGQPLKGRKLAPPNFKVGDRVRVLTAPPVVGTIEEVPKTSQGRYTLRIEGRAYPASFHEGILAPDPQPRLDGMEGPLFKTKAAKSGK
jgi:hypothetical protein